MADAGGDPPCWAEQVCESCGRLLGGADGHLCPTAAGPVMRRIEGFHRDEVGDWVAELSCLHSQHIRHQPPFQLRPWVLTEEGRRAALGTGIGCPRCGRAEQPEGLAVGRTAGPFDAATLPPGLLANHVVADRTWGSLHVTEGAVMFSMQTEPPSAVLLSAGDRQAIPPGVPHALTLVGAVRLTVDFLTSPDEARRTAPPSEPLVSRTGL